MKAYWGEYGHYIVRTYAPQSDVRLVILGILIVISIIYPLIQKNNYARACNLLVGAAYEGYGPKQGGSKYVSRAT